MLYTQAGKVTSLKKRPTDAERAVVREVYTLPPTRLAPKGFFALGNRATLKN